MLARACIPRSMQLSSLNYRYKVTGSMGRGVFSTVVSAWDKEVRSHEREHLCAHMLQRFVVRYPTHDHAQDEQDVAIKIIRSNEMMKRAGEKELNFLRLLRDSDPHGRKRCIKILHHFFHRGHLCLVCRGCRFIGCPARLRGLLLLATDFSTPCVCTCV